MMNKFNYILAYTWNFFFRVIRKIIGRNHFRRFFYYGKLIKGRDFTNQYIYDKIMSGKPFLAARYGDVELRTIQFTIEQKFGLRSSMPQYIKKKMSINAGFFPTNDKAMYRFGELMLESSKSVDLFATWFNMLEDYVIHYSNKNAELCVLEYLEPFRSDKPWSKALCGKKVLVVHPFAESIKSQYAIREKLFENKDILPQFELLTYKAIQSQANASCEYDTWFDALDKMFFDIRQIDFDIAILGCGAYGLPLAAKIKSIGKQAIHLGGATQILFGIKGARWEDKPEIARIFNKYWVRPSSNERPEGAEKVEGACYW